MERSRKILLEISSVSQQVITVASKYADWKALRRVSRAHIQLEKDMRRVSVACNVLADSLGKSLSVDNLEFDIGLQDWLCADEPQICLDMLTAMIKLLRTDTSFWTMFNPWRGQPTQDRIKEAVELLNAHKDCFHFLFSAMAPDNEPGTQNTPQPQNQINSEQTEIQLQSLPLSAQPSVDTSTPDPPFQTRSEREIRVDKKIAEENERTLEGILKWLDGLNCAEKQDRTLLLRQPGTCEWLFETTQYKAWWDGKTSHLWLRGKPGAGKSVLASSVIKSLEEIQRKGGILAFFYCDFGNERSTNASEVFCSLLSQLLRQLTASGNVFGSLLHDLVYAKDRGGATRNTVKELAGFIVRAAGLFAQRPLVIVDALDECKDVEDLLEGLIALQEHTRIFVTSRPLQVIKSELSGFSSISMDDVLEALSADIALHVTRALATRRRLRDLDADTKTEIHTVLCHRADGMFRWVECSIDTLNRCATMREVHEALTNLPEGLDGTYERILRAIDLKSREGQLALRALVWLVAALRPLKIQELMEGLSIDLGSRMMDFSIGPMHKVALLDACGSLVTYSEKTEIIILSHFSVKEYLIGEVIRARLPMYHINWELAHLQVVRLCMCYISICLDRLRKVRSSSDTLVGASHGSRACQSLFDCAISLRQPLRDYVMDGALGHFQHVGSQFSLVLHDLEVLTNDIEQHWYMWDNMCLSTEMDWESTTLNWPVSKHDLTIYVLVAFSPNSVFYSNVSRVLKPKKGTNPLIYAAYFNREDYARTLLLRGANLSRKGWGMDGSHLVLPIEVAANRHHRTMVTLCLVEESPVPASIFRRHLCTYSHTPSPILAMLLNTDDFVEVANDANGPVLDIIMLLRLFRSGASSSKQDFFTAIRRLIQAAANSLTVNGRYHFRLGFLLHFVMEFCDEDDALAIAKFLDEYDAGEFPSSEETVRVALSQGCPTVLQYLLSTGLSLPPDHNVLRAMKDRNFSRSLMSTIRFLTEKGIDVHANTKDGCGDSWLHVVLQSDCEDDILDMTKRLIGYGCDPREANLVGETPFHIALQRGHLSVARYLHSLNVPFPPHALSIALGSTSQNRVSTVRFLTNNGADASDIKTPGSALVTTDNPAIHMALRLGAGDMATLEIIKLLINYGCDPFQVNSSGQSTIHIAIMFAYPFVIRHLLSLGIPLPSDSLLVALEVTLTRWSLSTAQDAADITSLFCFLIKSGANTRTHTKRGESVLHCALKAFKFDGELALNITTLLVTSGCNPLEADSFGKTPFHIAVEQGQLSVVEYFCSLDIPLPHDSLCLASTSRFCLDTAQMVHFLINNGADINACFPNGDSPYHAAFLASRYNCRDALGIAKLLVNSGCNPLKVDSRGQSPLYIAIQHGLNSVIRYLLSLGIPLPPDSLLVASRPNRCIENQTLLVRLLLDNGADVQARTEEGHTALHVALLPDSEDYDEHIALEIAKILVACGSGPFQVPASATSILKGAVERVRTPTARYLITLGVPLPPDALLIVLSSSQCRNVTFKASMVYLLIDNGADVRACTASGDSALHLVLKSGFDEEEALEIAERLVASGHDPFQVNSQGRSVIQTAIAHTYTSVVKYLLSLGVPLPPGSLLDIFCHSKRWDPDLFCLLVENGYDIHECTPDGDPLFHVALRSFNEWDALEMVRLLACRDFDPLQVGSSGEVPLHVALERRYVTMARFLWSIDPCNAYWDCKMIRLASD